MPYYTILYYTILYYTVLHYFTVLYYNVVRQSTDERAVFPIFWSV